MTQLQLNEEGACPSQQMQTERKFEQVAETKEVRADGATAPVPSMVRPAEVRETYDDIRADLLGGHRLPERYYIMSPVYGVVGESAWSRNSHMGFNERLQAMHNSLMHALHGNIERDEHNTRPAERAVHPELIEYNYGDDSIFLWSRLAADGGYEPPTELLQPEYQEEPEDIFPVSETPAFVDEEPWESQVGPVNYIIDVGDGSDYDPYEAVHYNSDEEPEALAAARTADRKSVV